MNVFGVCMVPNNPCCSIGSTLSASAKSKSKSKSESEAADEKERHSSVSSTPNTSTLLPPFMIFGASINKFDNINCVGKEFTCEEQEEEEEEKDAFYIVKTASLLQANDHGGKRKSPHQYIDFFALDSDENKADQEPVVGPRYSPPTDLDLDLSIGRGNWEQPAAVAAEDLWTFKKVLTRSDVDGSSRLMLKKVFVHKHILPRVMGNRRGAPNDGERFDVNVRDVDTGSEHMLVLTLWGSSKSFVLTKNWMSEFVKRRELEEDDEIGLRWDDENSRLEFTLLRKKLI